MSHERSQGDIEREPRAVHFQILRQGRTDWNLEGRIQGNVQNNIRLDRIDEYLSELGVGNLIEPDAFVVSALNRTTQTAKAIIRFNNWPDTISIATHEGLNEKKWGIFEGLTDAVARPRVINEPELRPDFPDVKTLEDVAAIWEHPHFKVPGGESSSEVKARVLPALAEIAAEHAGKNLCMISHAGVLIALGLDPHSINEFRMVYDPQSETWGMKVPEN